MGNVIFVHCSVYPFDSSSYWNRKFTGISRPATFVKTDWFPKISGIYRDFSEIIPIFYSLFNRTFEKTWILFAASRHLLVQSQQ